MAELRKRLVEITRVTRPDNSIVYQAVHDLDTEEVTVASVEWPNGQWSNLISWQVIDATTVALDVDLDDAEPTPRRAFLIG